MGIKHWDEGISWSCLPHAALCFLLTLIFLVMVPGWWWIIPVSLGILFMICRSGCSWDEERRMFRSMMGWKWNNRWITWSSWQHVPLHAGEFKLDHTKHSLMNRRGADRAVGIESWELYAADGAGHRINLHEFTDAQLAREVLGILKRTNH